jgi:hypothetical protein
LKSSSVFFFQQKRTTEITQYNDVKFQEPVAMDIDNEQRENAGGEGEPSVVLKTMTQTALRFRIFSLIFSFFLFLEGLETEAYFPSVEKAFKNSIARISFRVNIIKVCISHILIF